MNQENRETAYQGRLPAMAPLANPYVPFQLENPPKYEAKKALTRGTLFPGLDLPFLGMVNKENLPATTLAELQALDFAIVELALYLDTHREDMEALELYRKYQELYDRCRQVYEKSYGPLNRLSVRDNESYAWLDNPWPWELGANKEG